MIDNKLYKVLSRLLKAEKHYYCKISLIAATDAFKKLGIPPKEVLGAVRALIDDGYMAAADISGNYFYLTPKAHATVEEVKRTRLMFWLPVIISITSVLISLVSLISSILC